MGLTLTRDVGKKIMIGDDIVIEVIGIVGKQARLHIDAPKNISVDREEVRLRKETGIDERDAQPTSNANVPAREILRLKR